MICTPTQEKIHWFKKLDSIGFYKHYGDEAKRNILTKVYNNLAYSELDFLSHSEIVYNTSRDCYSSSWSNGDSQFLKVLGNLKKISINEFDYKNFTYDKAKNRISYSLDEKKFEYKFILSKFGRGCCNQLIEAANGSINEKSLDGKFYYPKSYQNFEFYPGYLFYLKPEQVKFLTKNFNLKLYEVSRQDSL